MKKTVLDPNSSTQADCIAAWSVLKTAYYKSDLLRAFYGGMACGDIKYTWDIHSARRHDSRFVSLEPLQAPELSVDNEGTITNRLKLRLEDMASSLPLIASPISKSRNTLQCTLMMK